VSEVLPTGTDIGDIAAAGISNTPEEE